MQGGEAFEKQATKEARQHAHGHTRARRTEWVVVAGT